MPMNGSTINPDPVNPYYAASDKAVAGQRPFQPRKRAMKRAAGVQAWAGSDHAILFGQGVNGGRTQAASEDLRPANSSGENPNLR